MKKVVSPLIAMVLTAALSAGTASCSFKSFSASSRSSSSPSRWSSASSRSGRSEKPGEASVRAVQSSFQEEVSAVTLLYVRSNGTADEYMREIGSAAQRHGISYWENDPAAYRAIGRGLARANVPNEAVAYLPFLKNLKSSPHYDLIVSSDAR